MLKKYLKKDDLFSTNGHNSTQRYVKEVVRMKRNSNVSESWAEVQDKGGSNTQKIPESTFKSKKIHDADNTQDKKDKENKNDESNSKARKNDKYIARKKNTFADKSFKMFVWWSKFIDTALDFFNIVAKSFDNL